MSPSPLVPCPACDRHVRAGDAACPFCGGALSTSVVATPALPPGLRLGRAATFAFGATLGLAACGDGGSAMPLYGAAPSDSGIAVDAADSGGGGALYGGAPTDSGAVDAASESSVGMSLYGGPPVDGG